MQELQEGAVFAGRYRIIRCLAAGGMGAVYEVVHLETDRRRALKVMLPHVFQSPELRDRFKREARIAAHVESEFIVDVSDAGIDEATQMPYLVMELLRGEELGKRLARVGRLSPTEVVTYLRQAALALDKTHRASIVHRDLKPENLYLTENEEGRPRIKILDFGIAKLVAESSTQANATRSIGTPLYMSPEQFLALPITGAADIYSLGLLAYTFLVGVPYWADEARGEGSAVAFGMIAVHGPREPASVRAARRDVTLSPAFDAWFARATAVAPSQRFPSATSAATALAEALGAADVAAASARLATPEPRAPQASSPAFGLNEATQVLAPGMATPSSGVTTPLLASRPPPPEVPMSRTVAAPTRASRSRSVVMAFTAAVMIAGLLGAVGLYWSMHHDQPPRSAGSIVEPAAAPSPPVDPGPAPPAVVEPSSSTAAAAPSISAPAAERPASPSAASRAATSASSSSTPLPPVPTVRTKGHGNPDPASEYKRD